VTRKQAHSIYTLGLDFTLKEEHASAIPQPLLYIMPNSTIWIKRTRLSVMPRWWFTHQDVASDSVINVQISNRQCVHVDQPKSVTMQPRECETDIVAKRLTHKLNPFQRPVADAAADGASTQLSHVDPELHLEGQY